MLLELPLNKDNTVATAQRTGKSVTVSQQIFFATAKALYSDEELLQMVAEYGLDQVPEELTKE